MNSLPQLKALFQKHRTEIVKDFFTFLEFPSISAEEKHRKEMHACADWLKKEIEEIGLRVEVWETKNHPTLFATYDKAGKDKPCVLIYNHYDVQPVDPLELWDSPPFEPTLKGETVYARGAQDNKGQCFYVLQAIKRMLELHGKLPVNVKWCIEGEEEIGSPGIQELLTTKKKELAADHLIVADFGLKAPGVPTISLGLRGIVTMTLEVVGSKTDLHSGEHGGIAYNPIHALVELLASLRDANGKITIPGFYDDVEPLTAEEKRALDFDFDEKEYEKIYGGKPIGGEKAFSPLESCWIRPTLEINGISGGYEGDGFKTVIAAKAMAKISCRLVPNQDPEKVVRLVEKALKERIAPGMHLSVKVHPGFGAPMRSPSNTPIANAMRQAYTEVFQKPCVAILAGGSVSVVKGLASVVKNNSLVLMGLGLGTDQIHAPNEHFGLDRIEMGTLIIARCLEILEKN